MIKFSVPTNWQKDLLPQLEKKFIAEMYGKFAEDLVGGGRMTQRLPLVTKSEFAGQIKAMHDQGIKFNYLLNATCLNNLELTLSWREKFYSLLEYLISVEVDRFTIGVPYLLECIKKRYPVIPVTVSVQAGIHSIRQAKFWESLGADEITLSLDLNRDFALLKQIRKTVKSKLKLMANNTCLYGCPFLYYHANSQAHASQSSHFSKRLTQDYCTLRCRYIKFSQPEEFIRSRWIRPEDISVYESLGIDCLKFVDRAMPTEALCLIVQAYTQREYLGNLFDLFAGPLVGKGSREYIDNRKLGKFLQYFKKHDCKSTSCDNCGYCKNVAKQVVKISKEKCDRVIEEYKTFIELA